MKLTLRKLEKLLNFLIKSLLKIAKAGIKTINETEILAEKTKKIQPVLLGLNAVIDELFRLQAELKKISEEEASNGAGT